MSTQAAQLLTIYTEAVLEDRVIEEIMALGAKGYTVCDARGRGAHGLRTGKWTPGANIRVEVLGSSELCQRIINRLQEEYGRNYGLLMFTADVQIYSDGDPAA